MKQQIKPEPRQLAFLDWEMGAFFHFGIRTFYEGHKDWDHRPMPAAGFLPTDLDCGQWMRSVKAAGIQYAILTCKHHDGFANWPTRYSDYSVAGSSWQDSRGDVVRAFTDACRAYGIKVGLYYSPADETMKTGRRTAKEHDDFFVNQISELLTQYGRIDYLWFDGCGSEGHRYDVRRLVDVMRTLQPEMLLFGMWDHQVRWIGNEEGFAPERNESVVTYPAGDNHFPHLDHAVTRFLPAECDFRLRAKNWFYSDCDEATIKSVPELLGIYDLSVGRGSNFLINIAPDRRGQLPEADVRRLAEFGQALRRRFAAPVASTWSEQAGCLTIKFAVPALFNTLVLQEDLTDGQAIDRFAVSFTPGHVEAGKPVLIGRGETVGHKRILTFPALYAQALTVEITSLAEKAAYFSAAAVYLDRHSERYEAYPD
jgi:alpha-L-fucosidase